MTNSETNPLADTLVYEDRLPLVWSARSDDAQAENYARIAEHNEHVMRCVNMLSDQIREKGDDESETESAVVRLEAKVNLLLEMVSRMEREKSDLPDTTHTRLAAAGIEWNCLGDPPGMGDEIWISLYIDDRVPEPLKLAACVISVSGSGPGAVVCARFEEMGESVRDQLQKMIFRHHRRMIAQSRLG